MEKTKIRPGGVKPETGLARERSLWETPTRKRIGHVNGLESINGVIEKVNGRGECIVLRADGARFICHTEWFIEVKPESGAKLSKAAARRVWQAQLESILA